MTSGWQKQFTTANHTIFSLNLPNLASLIPNTLKKLIIIEEDTDAREMAVFTFEHNGYEVTRSTKETAIDDAARMRPHIIVIGAQLGNTPGNDLCLKLKKNELTGQIPIILYSPNKTVDEISKGSCADGHIAKPLELEDFIYLVHRIALS